MATSLHPESRRMYSWWWDSHISPKNSKWLQENLTGQERCHFCFPCEVEATLPVVGMLLQFSPEEKKDNFLCAETPGAAKAWAVNTSLTLTP
ncbi:hypothetical protein IFM89_031761 [Coptis chinensis]|uniref:Uncharacterized protein n=1 Tax=Coptis chinensis TaxID=261450 RepID=A0A835H211_9MAGN|nr:hypothetical protein IFM89_031761 [Coptis chinensis]